MFTEFSGETLDDDYIAKLFGNRSLSLLLKRLFSVVFAGAKTGLSSGVEKLAQFK